jgi:hypothetical protein
MKSPTKKYRARGAALVEGAVVMPVLVLFLAFFKYAYGSYDKKLEMQNKSQLDAMQESFRACTGSKKYLPPSRCNTVGGKAPETGFGERNPGTSQKFSIASSAAPLERTVTANSYILCDEKDIDQYIGGVVTAISDVFYPTPMIEPTPAGEGCQ